MLLLKLKSLFDVLLALLGLVLLLPLFFFLFIAASLSTKEFGVFSQKRIGKNGKPFLVYKFRSMKSDPNYVTTVTTSVDKRITKFGGLMRRFKLDELPQLINILKGEMSFVGPRPDVSGYADKLVGDDRIILSIKPGITGPAQLFYREEETLLATQCDPKSYNKNIIWPKKVEINKQYVNNWSFTKDLYYIIKTVF